MRSLTTAQTIIRDVLIYCARRRRTVTYDDLAEIAGKRLRGPWKDLDAITKAEGEAGRPDLTWVAVKKKTGLPAKYMGRELIRKDERRVGEYRRDLESLYQFWERIARDDSALRLLERERDAAFDSRRESGDRPCSDSFDRQDQDDQDFVDAITDWDWDEK